MNMHLVSYVIFYSAAGSLVVVLLVVTAGSVEVLVVEVEGAVVLVVVDVVVVELGEKHDKSGPLQSIQVLTC